MKFYILDSELASSSKYVEPLSNLQSTIISDISKIININNIKICQIEGVSAGAREEILRCLDEDYLDFLYDMSNHLFKVNGSPVSVDIFYEGKRTKDDLQNLNKIPLFKRLGYYSLDAKALLSRFTYNASTFSYELVHSALQDIIDSYHHMRFHVVGKKYNQNKIDCDEKRFCNLVSTISPGHQAGKRTCMGGCYINHAFIAATTWITRLPVKFDFHAKLKYQKEVEYTEFEPRVIILDLNPFWGRGTEELVKDNNINNNITYMSIHQKGGYPYFHSNNINKGEEEDDGGHKITNVSVKKMTDENWMSAFVNRIHSRLKTMRDASTIRQNEDTLLIVTLGDNFVPSFNIAGRLLAEMEWNTLIIQEGQASYFKGYDFAVKPFIKGFMTAL